MKSGFSFFPFISSVDMIDVDYYQELNVLSLLDIVIFNRLSIAVNGTKAYQHRIALSPLFVSTYLRHLLTQHKPTS